MSRPGMDQPPALPPAPPERPLHHPAVVPAEEPRLPPARRCARPAARTASRRVAPVLLVLATVTGAAACGGTAGAFGASPADARGNAHDFLTGLALRFGPLERDSVLSASRALYVRASLTPSRIWDERAIWSSRTDSTRTIAVHGRVADGGYELAQQPAVAAPSVPGEARHLMHLRRLDADEFEWRSSGEIAVGDIGASDLRRVFRAIVGAAEGRSEGALRAAYRTRLPRATHAAGRVFRLDTLRLAPSGDGATSVSLAISVHPEGARDVYPHFAEYLEKYAARSSYEIVLRDRAGAAWMVATAGEHVLGLRFRVREGRIVPLVGALRERPDTMVLEIDVRTKISIFELGVRDLRAELVYVDAPRELGWRMRFHERPEWDLPLGTERLLRTPLERPFRDEGVLNYIYLREGAGAPAADGEGEGNGATIVGRDFRIAVEESAIVRFLNRISSSAMRDVTDDVERERDAFIAEMLVALRDDLLAQLPAPALEATR